MLQNVVGMQWVCSRVTADSSTVQLRSRGVGRNKTVLTQCYTPNQRHGLRHKQQLLSRVRLNKRGNNQPTIATRNNILVI